VNNIDILYILTPFIAWFIAGVTKFFVNYIRFKKKAFKLVGNGGFPSTHTTVVASPVMLIGFTEGFFTPIFMLGLTFLYITIIDATGIRRTIGVHAQTLNKHLNKGEVILRERQGHNRLEIAGGLVLGLLLGYISSLMM
jgi:uncharacterized protein